MYLLKTPVVDNAAELAEHDPELFTMIRRGYFGASDSSVLLGVNPYQTIDKLLAQKQSPTMTDEEVELSEKPTIRMGRDMEPIILQKFIDMTSIVAIKPEPMYRLGDTNLSVNYDALTKDNVPVEIKCISFFGDKNWDFNKAYTHQHQHVMMTNIAEKIKAQAKMVGVPPYYYTQVQQQLLGVEADVAYIAAFSTKQWQLYYFIVDQDEEIQEALINAAQMLEIKTEANVMAVEADENQETQVLPDWF